MFRNFFPEIKAQYAFSQKSIRYAKKLYAVSSSGDDHCVLATTGVGDEDGLLSNGNNDPLDDGTEFPYLLSVCNALGTTVDAKQLPATLEPLSVCMTRSHVIAASRERVMAWHYRTAQAITVHAMAEGGRSKSGAHHYVSFI